MWWFNSEPYNFGDWIGPEIFKYRTGSYPVFSPVSITSRDSPVYVTVGSIFDVVREPNIAHVWGSGIIKTDVYFEKPYKISAVRGPITLQRVRDLGYACEYTVGDPGILLPFVFPFSKSTTRYSLGIVPHYFHRDAVMRKFRNDPSVCVIDVTAPVRVVVSQIQMCDRLISSSLHGIIASHAYGKKCAWVNFGANIGGDDTKFLDYALSVNLDLEKFDIDDLEHLNLDDLIKMSSSSALPELSDAQGKLWKSCPF